MSRVGDTNISSTGQKGGITAHTVNAGGAIPPKPSWAKRVMWWVVGIATVVGAIAGVWQVFLGGG
jgi:hypothetical protein